MAARMRTLTTIYAHLGTTSYQWTSDSWRDSRLPFQAVSGVVELPRAICIDVDNSFLNHFLHVFTEFFLDVSGNVEKLRETAPG